MKNFNETPLEYQQDLARALCQEMNFANLPFNVWFKILTTLKNLGFTENEVRQMCVGSDKYKDRKFTSEWKSAHKNYNIGVIVNTAKIYAPNFNYTSFYKQWFKDNPQYDTRNFNGVGKPARIAPTKKPAAPMKEQTQNKSIADNPIFQQKYLEFVQADIIKARGNLRDFIKLCKECKFRGLTLETLEYFGVGYIEKWISPKIRALIELNQYKENGKPKNPPPPSRRIIISSGNHYNAVALPEDRKNIPKNFWKMHAGEKVTFGLQTLHADTKYIFATEGEIDAMSIRQAMAEIKTVEILNFGFIANLSLSATSWYNDLDKIFASRAEKPIVIWIGDGDHRDDDEKHRQELLKRGYPAFVNYYTDENKKCDSNDILCTGGEYALFSKLRDFWGNAETNLDAAKIEIEKIQAELQAAAELERAEKEKAEYEIKINHVMYLPQTDMDNAKRLAIMFGDIIRYNTTTELWGFYKNGVWKFETSSNSALYPFANEIADIIKANIPELRQQNFTQNADGSIEDDPNFIPPTDEEKKQVAIFDNLQRSWRRNKTQRNAIEMVKGIRQMLITQKDLDAYPNLINVKNGVIDLKTGKYYPASPTFYLTQQAGANYIHDWQVNSDHKVEKFLREILPNDDFREFLLMWLAYSLTGEVNEEKFVFIKGRGGNGKGTLTKILLKMAGDYGCSFPIGGILSRKNYDANAATTAINILENKRLAFGEEIPPNAKTDPAQIKILTGGDNVPARKNYSEYRNIAPTWKITFSGNNDLQFPDANDYGIKRRLMLIPFTQDFTQNPNTNLKNELMEQDSIDYLFNKLVRLAPVWYKDGLQIPDAVKVSSNDYLKAQDFIADFIAEYCERRADGFISRKDFVDKLREAYPRETPYNNQTLKEMLEKIDGVEYQHSKKGKILKGIVWRQE